MTKNLHDLTEVAEKMHEQASMCARFVRDHIPNFAEDYAEVRAEAADLLPHLEKIANDTETLSDGLKNSNPDLQALKKHALDICKETSALHAERLEMHSAIHKLPAGDDEDFLKCLSEGVYEMTNRIWRLAHLFAGHAQWVIRDGAKPE